MMGCAGLAAIVGLTALAQVPLGDPIPLSEEDYQKVRATQIQIVNADEVKDAVVGVTELGDSVACEVAQEEEFEYDYLHLATVSNNIGYYDTALDFAMAALGLDDQSGPAYLQAGIALEESGLHIQAQMMLEQALKFGLQNKEDELAAYQYQAKNFRAQNQDDNAMAAIGRGLEIDGDDTYLLLERAEILLPTDPERAERDLERVIKLENGSANGYYQVAMARFLATDYKNALTDINKAISLESDVANSYTLRGLIQLALGDVEASLRDEVMGMALDSDYAYELLSQVDDPYNQSIIISEIDSLKEGDPGLMFKEANLLAGWGDIDTAETLYRDLISQHQEWSAPYLELVNLYREKEKPTEAYNLLLEGRKAMPENAELVIMQAEVGTEIGKTPEVIAMLDEQLALNEEWAYLHRLKGHALLVEGRYGEAVPESEYYASGFDDPDATLDLMLAYHMLGNTEKANEMAAVIIDAPDEFRNAGLYRPDYYLALALAQAGSLDEARSMIDLFDASKDEDLYMDVAISTISGDIKGALDTLKSEIEKVNPEPAAIVYDAVLYPLHSDDEFGNIVKGLGVSVKRDKSTGLWRMK